MPTFGSLFAGIGGIDLGLERAGWTGRWQVEWDPFCQHVLAHHWPDVPRYGDITRVDWSTVEPVDLIAGGFPCQPVSHAGRRRAQSDARWLWPEFARCLRSLRPRLVLIENVPGLLRPWLDRDGCGLWHEAPIEEVVADLASLGYVGSIDGVSAADVGAPHLRERVWIVAHSNDGTFSSERGQRPSLAPEGAGRDSLGGGGGGDAWWPLTVRGSGEDPALADANSERREVERSGGLPDDRDASLRHDADGRDRQVADPDRARLEGRGGVSR